MSKKPNLILVIDDDKNTREILAARLKRLKHKPICASGTEDGLRLLNEHKGEVAAVFMDIRLEDGTDAGLAGIDAI